MGYELLFGAYDLVERLGAPMAIAAWLTVSTGSVGLALVLRRFPLRPHAVPAALLGCLSMAAHASDITLTLVLSPDLSLEGNPIWRVVLDRWGLDLAIAYGITGKLWVGVLNVELYLLYRATRERLYPAEARTFGEFVRRLGERSPRRFGIAWLRVVSLFSYLFGYLGLWSFWIAFQNWAGGTDLALYERLPSPPAVVTLGLLLLAAGYLVETWWAFRRSRLPVPAPTGQKT